MKRWFYAVENASGFQAPTRLSCVMEPSDILVNRDAYILFLKLAQSPEGSMLII